MSDPRVSDMTLPLADRIAAAGPGQVVPVTQEEFALIRNQAQPQPTDLDRFRALFDEVGARYKMSSTTTIIAGIGKRFQHLFCDDMAFDARGKFLGGEEEDCANAQAQP